MGGGKTIRVSFLGYKSQLIEVGTRTQIDVTLEEDRLNLDAVVVVAFGTTTREAFTGSAAVVKSEDLAKRQVTNVASALAGAAAGVQVTSSSGSPSSEPSILIRGVSSIYADKGPLYVVDGVPYAGSLNQLNMADVESLTILKDAASTALYGSRGANGVILITTKRAKKGDALITFDAKWGVNSRATKFYDYIDDPKQYYEMHYSALANYYTSQGMGPDEVYRRANETLTSNNQGGLGYLVYTVPDGEYFIGTNGKVNPNAQLGRTITGIDGQEYYLIPDDYTQGYKNTFRQEYSLSLSASNDRASVYASLGWLDNNGIVANSNYNRYTGRLRADYQAKSWLKMGANMAFTHSERNSPTSSSSASTTNAFYFMNSTAPIYPLYLRDADGNIMVDGYGMQMYDYGDATRNLGITRPIHSNANALQTLQLDSYKRDGNAFNGTAFADIQLTKDLVATFNMGTNFSEYRYNTLYNSYYGSSAQYGGRVAVENSRTFELNAQQLLNYNHTFGDRHRLSVLVGHESYNRKSYSFSAGKEKIFSNDNDELNGAIIDSQTATSSRSEYNNEGYLGRAEYEYDNRIILSGSFRRDASSRFHPDHRWGNFWSLSAAWLINHESWFTAKWVDMLKLKASIGSQGNDGVDNYLYTDLYTIEEVDGEISTQFYWKGNPDITWETNTNINVGVDFELFQGRFGGTIEYFNRKTSDMLNYFAVAPSAGYDGYWDNIGDMRNRGFEIDLHATPIRTKNFTWSVSLNLSHYKNEVTRIADENKTSIVEGYAGYQYGTKFVGEGLSYYSWYMPTYAGVDRNTGESLWYRDVLDADGNVTGRTTTSSYGDATYYIQKTALPDLYGGFSTSLEFYGVDISASFAYQIGGKSYDSGYAAAMSSPYSSTVGFNFHKDLLNAWTPENPDSNIPRLQYNDSYTGFESSRFLTDASYLNISNITVGYTLPRKFTAKLGLSSVRIYLACDNVYYWSRRDGFDPRYSYTGSTSYYNYSPIRTISGGINLQF